MIKFKERKLIVEIENSDPLNDLQMLQREIINAIQYYDYLDNGSNNGCPFLMLLELLKATLPTHEEYRQLLTATNHE